MADRTSAAVFATIFEYLAEPGPINKRELAYYLWGKQQYYDFTPDQMDVDDVLIKYGLASYCETCEVLKYIDQDWCDCDSE